MDDMEAKLEDTELHIENLKSTHVKKWDAHKQEYDAN